MTYLGDMVVVVVVVLTTFFGCTTSSSVSWASKAIAALLKNAATDADNIKYYTTSETSMTLDLPTGAPTTVKLYSVTKDEYQQCALKGLQYDHYLGTLTNGTSLNVTFKEAETYLISVVPSKNLCWQGLKLAVKLSNKLQSPAPALPPPSSLAFILLLLVFHHALL